MVEFETLKDEIIEFGENEFIQVARKTAVSDEGERQFLSLARGFITDDGSRRYKNNFSIPADEDIVDFITEQLPALLEED